MSHVRTGILFVCLGNICRSPLAWGVFRHQARERGVLDRFDSLYFALPIAAFCYVLFGIPG